MLTAVDGEGQQCKAAPACTASIEPETNGSLETSALTRISFLLTINGRVMNQDAMEQVTNELVIAKVVLQQMLKAKE